MVSLYIHHYGVCPIAVLSVIVVVKQQEEFHVLEHIWCSFGQFSVSSLISMSAWICTLLKLLKAHPKSLWVPLSRMSARWGELYAK